MSGFGGAAFGGAAFGDGDEGLLHVVDVVAVSDRAVRAWFSARPSWRNDRATGDAADPGYYRLVAEGEARPVQVAGVALVAGSVGMAVDVFADRSFSGFPESYGLIAHGFSSASGWPLDPASFPARFYGAAAPAEGRALGAPSASRGGRDLAGSPPTIDQRGDYGYDSADASLRKRIYRRLVTDPSAFAHLPGYGAGLRSRIKRLGSAAERARAKADAEAQLVREPDVARATVELALLPRTPSILRMVVLIERRSSGAERFTYDIEAPA